MPGLPRGLCFIEARCTPSAPGKPCLPTARRLPSRQEAVHGGEWNGKPFSEFSDSDPRIGANLEVFIAGSYTWIPIHYLRRLEIEPPANLRDLMWARARVETSSDFRLQELGEVLLPVLCPLSSSHADESVHLGRESAWEPDDDSWRDSLRREDDAHRWRRGSAA